MAFARAMCKAIRIERIKKDLVSEKQNAIRKDRGLEPHYNIRQKYKHFWIDVRIGIKRCLKKSFSFPEHTCMHRTCYNLRHEGTCENFTIKSIAGFIGGFLLTYVFFMFFVFQLNFKLSTATIMCSIFGCILTIGLAFSYKVRCVVFLLLPQFFSKRGRQALLAYAFVLAITGPAKNTLNNVGILSESLACGQEQLKQAVKQIIDVIKKPFYAIKDAIKEVIKTIKVIVKKIKEILLTIKRIIMAILKVIKAAFQFLAKIISICNKEIGTPFERCGRVFENAIQDCNAKLGPLFNWLCSVTYLVKSVCYVVKMFDFVCMLVDYINDSIIGTEIRKIKSFVRHIRTMFYVRIRFSHSFHFETNQTKSMSDITEGIVTEIRHRSEKLLTVFDLISCGTSMFFLFIIIKVMHYRYKFLTNERFDNKFITKDFRKIDMRRAQLEKETVLPLNHREKTVYIVPGKCKLVKSEKVQLSKSAMVLWTATLKLCTHMAADYALYWVLTLIRYHARFQSSVSTPNMPALHIEGKGLLADLLRSIVKAFQPVGINLEIDTIPCLPDPIPPDYDRYVQIGSLLVLCWFLTVFEPYGLRLRNTIMCYYHPTRAKQRAVWLYNHIIRSRSSFLKFARRQLKRKVLGTKGITKVTCKEYLRANIKSRWLRLCLGPDKQEACLLCGEVFRESDKTKPVRCKTPACPGIYCGPCFNDLHNLCTVCLDPIQYGDLSDISEEKDSSEDDLEERTEKEEKEKRRKKRKCRISKCLEPKSDSDSDDDDKPSKSLLSSEKEPTPKTDYSSTTEGYSTDYSYTYQDQKDVTSLQKEPAFNEFVDLEKQYIPDYASMDSFRESYRSNLQDSGPHMADVGISVASFPCTESSEEESVHENYSGQYKPGTRNVAISASFSSSTTSSDDHAVPVMWSNILASPYSSSSVDSEIKRGNKIKMPPLDLSFIMESDPPSPYYRPSFDSKVKYEVASESNTPRSNISNKSVKSFLRERGKRREDSERVRTLAQIQQVRGSDNSNTKQRKEKIHGYYKNINRKTSDNPNVVKKRSNQFIKMIANFFRKGSKSSKSPEVTAQFSQTPGEVISLSSISRPNSHRSSDYSSDTSLITSYEVASLNRLEDSSETSLMGSTPRKHLRGGEDNFVVNENFAEPAEVNLTEHAIDNQYLDSSDTDISELLYIKKKKYSRTLDNLPAPYTQNIVDSENLENNLESVFNPLIQNLPCTSPPSPPLPTTFLPVQTSTHQMSVPTNSTCKGDPVQRYSREPAEKDEDPGVPMKASSRKRSPQYHQYAVQTHRNYPDHCKYQPESASSSSLSMESAQKILGNPVKENYPYNHHESMRDENFRRKMQQETEYFVNDCPEYPTDGRRPPGRNCRSPYRSKSTENGCHNCQRCSKFCGYCSRRPNSPCFSRRRSPEKPTTAYHYGEPTPDAARRRSPYKHPQPPCRNRSSGPINYNQTQCRCYNCSRHKPETSNNEDRLSVHSNTSEHSVGINLAYQNFEDYPDLVHELESTLIHRNKERVKKTMREFENMSRQNKNLEKPIIYDDEASDGEKYPSRSIPDQPQRQSPQRFKEHRREVKPFRMPQMNSSKESYQSPVQEQVRKYSQQQQKQKEVHWQLDPVSGEWYRVSRGLNQNVPYQYQFPCENDTDFCDYWPRSRDANDRNPRTTRCGKCFQCTRNKYPG